MINESRTLLLNITAYAGSTLPDGEEYIDPAFNPAVLSGDLKELHQIMVPANSARDYLNFLGFCYMRMLHVPDVAPYTLKSDPRFTYDLDSNYFIDGMARGDLAYSFNATTLYAKLLSKILAGNSMSTLFNEIHPDIQVFRKLWNNGDSDVDRLTGAVLALIYQIGAL